MNTAARVGAATTWRDAGISLAGDAGATAEGPRDSRHAGGNISQKFNGTCLSSARGGVCEELRST
jgi:hypothetical protein